MLRQREAPQGVGGTDGAIASKALRAQRRFDSITNPTDFGNQDVQDGVCLDELLAEFVALNHDRYYPELHASQDTSELPVAPFVATGTG